MTTDAIITLRNIDKTISVRIDIDGCVDTVLVDLATFYSGQERTEQALKAAYFRNFENISEKDPTYVDRVVWDTDTRYAEADWVYEVDEHGVLSLQCMNRFHPASKRPSAHPFDYLAIVGAGYVAEVYDTIDSALATLAANGVALSDVAPCPKCTDAWQKTLKEERAAIA